VSETASATSREVSEWLDASQDAGKDDYVEKLKELEDVCNPVFAAVYQKSGGGDDGAYEDDHDEL
jgi:heat shock protein 5